MNEKNDKRDEKDAKSKFFLVQFAHRHMDFQLAELESVLDLFHLLHLCEIHPLPNDENIGLWRNEPPKLMDKSNMDSLNNPCDRTGISFSFYCRTIDKQKLQKNSQPDTSCSSITEKSSSPKETENGKATKSNIAKRKGDTNGNFRPFLILSFRQDHDDQDELILKVLSRCVLVRSVIELWGSGKDIIGCENNIKQFWTNENEKQSTTIPKASSSTSLKNLIQKHCIKGKKSWKLTIHTFGSKYTREEQNTMRSHFSFLPFAGPVKMENPDDEYILIREVEVDSLGSPIYPRHSHKKEVIPQNDARPPLAVYFGRILLSGMREGRVDKYSLKKRKYLGPTSMDTELSMIMTNLGQVNSQISSLIYISSFRFSLLFLQHEMKLEERFKKVVFVLILL